MWASDLHICMQKNATITTSSIAGLFWRDQIAPWETQEVVAEYYTLTQGMLKHCPPVLLMEDLLY